MLKNRKAAFDNAAKTHLVVNGRLVLLASLPLPGANQAALSEARSAERGAGQIRRAPQFPPRLRPRGETFRKCRTETRRAEGLPGLQGSSSGLPRRSAGETSFLSTGRGTLISYRKDCARRRVPAPTAVRRLLGVGEVGRKTYRLLAAKRTPPTGEWGFKDRSV